MLRKNEKIIVISLAVFSLAVTSSFYLNTAIQLQNAVTSLESKIEEQRVRIDEQASDIADFKKLKNENSSAMFDEDAWESIYEKTPQYVSDCYKWQSTHPDTQKKSIGGECSLGNGGPDDHCDYTMRKKSPDGSVKDIVCNWQYNPTDFIP